VTPFQGAIIYVVVAFLCAFFFFGCATRPVSTAAKAPRFCVIRQADKMCWYSQVAPGQPVTAAEGVSLDLTEGWFSISPSDIDTLLEKMAACHESK
jgi:hypothetical protein